MILLWLLACGHLGSAEPPERAATVEAARVRVSPGKPGAPVRYEGPDQVWPGLVMFTLLPDVALDSLRVEVRAGAEVLHQSMGGPLDAGEPYEVRLQLSGADVPHLAVRAETTVGVATQSRSFAVPVVGAAPVGRELPRRDGRGRNIVAVP